MAKLILQPEWNSQTREAIESHLEAVRARRLVAAIEFYENKNEKLSRQSEVKRRQINQQYEMLQKEMDRFDKLDDAIQRRLRKIEELSSDFAHLVSAIIPVGDDTDTEEEYDDGE